MVKKILLTLFFLFLFSFSLEMIGCRGAPMPIYEVFGTVTDSITAEAIDSAQIVLGDTLNSVEIFYTNSAGNYTAHPHNDGIIEIFCRKTGYSTKVISLELKLRQYKYKDINFELTQLQ